MEIFEAGDVVQITKRPVGCCGVLRQGWFGTIESVIEVEHTGTGEVQQILILDDNTLVWGSECEHRTSRGVQ